jgi:hypothetical protein
MIDDARIMEMWSTNEGGSLFFLFCLVPISRSGQEVLIRSSRAMLGTAHFSICGRILQCE